MKPQNTKKIISKPIINHIQMSQITTLPTVIALPKSHPVIPYITMKRHLINDDEASSAKDEVTHCPKTSLVILGDCQTLVSENRENLEDRPRDLKRRKIQDARSKNHYLDLVSSAAKLLDEREAKDKKGEEDKDTQEEQHVPSSDQSCSVVSTLSSASGRSRCYSVSGEFSSSEFSVYRSYEMELPNKPIKECSKITLPRAPRLPTAMDMPFAGEIRYKLYTRHYGERPALIEDSKHENQIQIQSVIYR